MNQTLLEEVLRYKVISIIRGVSSQQIVETVRALVEGGIRFVEVTFNPADEAMSQDTLKSIKLLNREFSGYIHLGAGTVLTPQQAEAAAAAGAEFIISPTVNTTVIRRTKELGLLSMPGAYTPTEAQAAYEAGADIIKIFPADQLGTGYFKAIKAPLSHLHLAAVGGVTEENLHEFIEVGVEVFGIGNNLVNARIVALKDWPAITRAASAYMAAAKN